MTKTFISNEICGLTDIGLSATLITLGFPLQGVQRTNPHKIQFLFKRIGQLDQAIEAYWNNNLKVSPLEVLNNLKILKSRIHFEQ